MTSSHSFRYEFTKAAQDSESYLNLLLKPCIYRHAIKIDLGRTFPESEFFADPAGGGHKSLFNCLTAYSNLDEEVGYCQGQCQLPPPPSPSIYCPFFFFFLSLFLY